MAVTIYDIARVAKVGIGTVSRVFNHHPSVSDQTKERVLRVAGRMNYHPHPYARGLARKKTNSILAVIPFFTTFFFVEILQGVQSFFGESDHDLILHGVNHPEQAESTLRRGSLRGRADGILFFSMKMSDTLAEFYQQQRVPVVLVDAKHPQFDSFYVENIRGAKAAVTYLAQLGHKRIGILSANLESLPARERLEGYKQGMRESGLWFDSRWMKSTSSTRFDGFVRETGYELMKEFLALGSTMPTAIFVSSDIQAAGALTALEEVGLKSPDDVSLVGFDNIELAQHLGLTTMQQPIAEMGLLAAKRLAERMVNPSLKPQQVSFLPKLIERKSTAPVEPKRKTTSRTTPVLAHS